MAPAARITHQMEGRLRLHIPSRRRDVPYFEEIKQTLSSCHRVDGVSTNPLTASALVRGTAAADEIRSAGERSGLFTLVSDEFVPVAAGLRDRLGAEVDQLDERVNRATNGLLDLNGFAFLGFVSAAAWQLTKRRVLPEALTILFYAASLLPRSPRLPVVANASGTAEKVGAASL
jgi:hypothetical protein